jgi:hypothetical protein
MEKFDTGSKDLGFSGVRTLGEAADIVMDYELYNKIQHPHIAIVQNKFERRKSYYSSQKFDFGIHHYFIDRFGREIGYYTPIMDTLMIFATPRKVGIKQNLIYKSRFERN